ncbi:SAM-dependent methyltransferase [Streptosporangium subroseum]|uniref:SAM-dependent methyltransferase n=1 Tax=Streptosporangium subroseum TaxID=106412 RepID=UPI0034383282
MSALRAHAARSDHAPPGIDSTTPNVARMYDHYLGGKDNYAADRACADEVIRQAPHVITMARENRLFLGRAVRYLADEVGINQFLDIGAGLPTRENVHQVAQRFAPDARTVYVDNDPVVLSHGRALLMSDDHTWVIKQDLRAPDKILDAVGALGLLNLSRPVAVLLVAVLHFITDDEDPYRIVKTLMNGLAPGSHLVISHMERRPDLETAAANYRHASSPVILRSTEDVSRFFDGMELLDPGLVGVCDWHPEHVAYFSDRERALRCGVARKP